MKIDVNKDACIGCGACAAICPDVFEMDDEGLSMAKENEVSSEFKEDVIDAIESCPTGAIVEQ